MRLTALDRQASAQGLAIGMPLANARAMLPALKVAAANAPADHKLLEGIADWCDRFTPFVAIEPPRFLFLDITGAAHLFGGEEALLDLIKKALKRRGLAVRAAIAGTTIAARALARYSDGAIAPCGEEASFVAPLPAQALGLDPVSTHALRRAGLKTIGQIAERGRAELAARFGAGMVFALEQALGQAERPISPRLPFPAYAEEQRFAEPILTEELALATLGDLAARLAKKMEQYGEGARRLEAAFFRTDGIVRRLLIATGRPMREAATIVRLFGEKLKALADPLDPGFGFDLIRLAASHTEPLSEETVALTATADLAKEKDRFFDRMAARFGPARILIFQPQESHIPEAAFSAVPAQYAKPAKTLWENIRAPGEAPRRPLRLFAKPEPIDVTAEVPEGPPIQFRWRRKLHSVAFAEGPERIAMEWWRQDEKEPTRDYFRIESSEGKRFWLYRSGIYGRETASPHWFMHGIFA